MQGWSKAGWIVALASLASVAASCTTTEDKLPRHPEEAVNADADLVCRKMNDSGDPARPHWTRIPMGSDLSNNYPDAAAKRSLAGSATLDCKYKADGSLDCKVASEEPAGWGFGAAALRVAPCFQAVAGANQTYPLAGSAVEIPISFKR